MCRLSKNLGASTSWDPKGLSRPVMGLLICNWQSNNLHDVPSSFTPRLLSQGPPLHRGPHVQTFQFWYAWEAEYNSGHYSNSLHVQEEQEDRSVQSVEVLHKTVLWVQRAAQAGNYWLSSSGFEKGLSWAKRSNALTDISENSAKYTSFACCLIQTSC
jgi:hypothetical protein